MEHFYSTYKALQNKEVKVNGFGGAAKARAIFKEGLELYENKFVKQPA